MSSSMVQLDALVKNLLEIPANERYIGHFQVAMKTALELIIDELKAIRERAAQEGK